MIGEPRAARAFVEAVAGKTFGRFEEALDPAVRFRALVPGEDVSCSSSAEVAAAFERWFADKEPIELVSSDAAPAGDRVAFGYRLEVRRRGEPLVMEHWLCGDLENGKFVALDLLCSGFRPAGVAPAEGITHRFDAGDLGCGTGLPREFRARLAQIPVGHRLAVATRDAASREDLPALARMLGHKVSSVETDASGVVTVVVERTK